MSTEIAVLTKEIAELKHMVVSQKANRLNDSLFSKELAPHYMDLASQLAKSALVPKALIGKPNDLFIVMAMSYQVGLSIEQGIQCIAVINGRPCMWGDDMLALCMTHRDFVDIIEEPILNGHAIVGYNCTVKRRGMADHTQIFTLEMAKRAKLLTKPGPWQEYPERMMQLRARAFALRNRFPDALKGIKSREEVEDYIDGEFSEVDDGKLSRIEQTKQDILTKKGRTINAEITNQTPIDAACSENSHDSQTPDEDKESVSLGAVGESETQTSDGDDVVSILSKEQLHEINQLMDEKAFTEERLEKALVYYEANSIKQLSSESANHFIAQLKRA